MKQIVFALILGVIGSTTFAETVRINTRPDGNVTFDVSVSGPTRISVTDNRISNILQASSNFEMSNDEDTGDVFLRFAGGQPSEESGYIITETGHTVGFVMRPKMDLDNQTVLITINGIPPSGGAHAASAAADDTPGFVVDGGSGGASSRTAQLVDVTRHAFASKIGLRSAGDQKVGAFGSVTSGGLIAHIQVASAPNSIPPLAQNFYRSSRTMAVFVDDVVSSNKVWVVIVESRS